MGKDELKYVKEAFKTNWIAPLGPNVDAFELELCNYLDGGFAAALSSGTAAIHLALKLAKVGNGDFVLCQSFTFSATANPILYQGANPVFIDSEKYTWNMNPQLLVNAIKAGISDGKKPKACLVVHLYGMPAKIDEIKEICETYGIVLIEDAAEALGASYKGKKLGTFGTYGVFSFNGNKIITTSGGGALISADKEAIMKAKFWASQAKDPAPHYQHTEIGYNYRLSNVLAGIGRGQLMVLDKRVEARRAVYSYYKQELKTLPVAFLDEPKDYFSNRWLSCILFDRYETREKVMLALERENIESRPLWKPMHQQPLFLTYSNYLNGLSDHLFEVGLCLPSSSSLTLIELRYIVSIIKKALTI
jgi:dTDP-4-amino-4,6-dideoxygalactose transaminase